MARPLAGVTRGRRSSPFAPTLHADEDRAHASPEDEQIVVIRAFRPTIHSGKKREFEAFLEEAAIPLVSCQAGLIAQHVGKPRDPSSSEYLYVTVWDDVESIRAFAGDQWQAAVIAPVEQHLLKHTWIGLTRSSGRPTRRNALLAQVGR